MPADPVVCPACSSRLKRPASLRDGDIFECPMCARNSPSAARRKNPRGAGLRDEVDEEVGEELEIVSEGEGKSGRPRRRKKSSRKGVVELGRWISLGFTHWFPVLLPAVGFCILYVICYVLVSFVFGCAGGLLAKAHPLIGAGVTILCILSIMVSLSAGMTLVSVQQLQGKRWSFGDFFGGSQWWVALLLNWVLLEVLYIVLLGVPVVVITLTLNALSVSPLLIQVIVSTFQLVAFLALYPLTWMFSWQLILDGNYGPLESITENVRMALPNFFRLLLLGMLTLLIRLVGVMLFGIGFAAAWPLAVLIETTAYLH